MSDYVELGYVKDTTGRHHKVTWSEYYRFVYAGGTKVGEAASAKEAMMKAEAWSVQN